MTGNGKIMQELEANFRGAGWNVIKVVWGREWDALLAKDVDGVLVNQMNRTPDGQFQTYSVESGAYIREHFFGVDNRLRKMVEHLSDEEIERLPRGGHDYRKVYAAFQAAANHVGQPTVILAHTVKGWTIEALEGKNATHQMKKLNADSLKQFRDRLELPVSDQEIDDAYTRDGSAPFYHPGEDSDVLAYLRERRRALGGGVPMRRVQPVELTLPGKEMYDELRAGSGKQAIATTMAFVRLLKDLMKDPSIGKRIVPIAPDEYRTFGMDSMFSTAKIYNPAGQTYEAVDRQLLMAYKESAQGQMLHEGISEAGCVASATAAGSSYSTHGEPMIPVYIFYSMFGFQRTGDSIWAMADQLASGLPDRRHRRPHHADRRGPPARRRPLAAARADQPGRRALRPGVLLRDRPHHAQRPRPDVRLDRAAPPRRGRHLLPHRLQRARRAADRARRRRHRGDPRRHPPRRHAAGRPARRTPRASSCSPAASATRGSSRPSSCWPTTGASPPTPGRSRPGTSCPVRRWPPRSGTCSTPPSSRGSRSSPASSATPPAPWSRSATT